MPKQQLIMSLVLWVVVFGVFWLLLVRPQRKKDKELREMRNSLSVGDKVVTIGGMIATISKVKDDEVVLEVGPSRTKMPFEKNAIGTVLEKKVSKHKTSEESEEEETKEEK